ncbi:MAG: hypothetical protein K6E33_02155 [Lachnospiraceae bacterium]|nr:hypothetical protein [Lachnospiraceae bacterium]
MSTLLILKQNLKFFFSKWQTFLVPVFKFLFAFASLGVVNNALGYMSRLKSLPLVFVAALMCSIMPWGFTAFVAVVFVVLHMYALSMECALVMGAIFLLFYLLFSRFAPRDQVAVLLTPMCFYFRVPYAVPITAGLLGNPGTAVSVAIGTASWYMIRFVSQNEELLRSLSDEEINVRVKTIIDGAVGNKDMRIIAVSFAITVMTVAIIKKLSVDHAWTVAIVAGGIVEILSLLVMSLLMSGSLSTVVMITGTLLGVAVAFVVQFFGFHLDYSRQEKLQFEDDDYYYYVKAVPKMYMSAPEKKVRRINRRREYDQGPDDVGYDDGYDDGYSEGSADRL